MSYLVPLLVALFSVNIYAFVHEKEVAKITVTKWSTDKEGKDPKKLIPSTTEYSSGDIYIKQSYPDPAKLYDGRIKAVLDNDKEELERLEKGDPGNPKSIQMYIVEKGYDFPLIGKVNIAPTFNFEGTSDRIKIEQISKVKNRKKIIEENSDEDKRWSSVNAEVEVAVVVKIDDLEAIRFDLPTRKIKISAAELMKQKETEIEVIDKKRHARLWGSDPYRISEIIKNFSADKDSFYGVSGYFFSTGDVETDQSTKKEDEDRYEIRGNGSGLKKQEDKKLEKVGRSVRI